MKSFKVVIFFAAVLLLIGGVFLYADEKEKKSTWGFIVNTPNIFSQVDSYQGGIGLKTKSLKDMELFGLTVGMDLRFLLGLGLTNGFDIMSVKGGIAAEFHLYRTSRVTPYFGLLADVEYNKIRTELEDESWTQVDTIPFSVGAMAGIEFFLMEFLSFFVEYNVVLSLQYTKLTGSDIPEPEPEFNYSIETGIGNAGMIGIAIYFQPVVTIKK